MANFSTYFNEFNEFYNAMIARNNYNKLLLWSC